MPSRRPVTTETNPNAIPVQHRTTVTVQAHPLPFNNPQAITKYAIPNVRIATHLLLATFQPIMYQVLLLSLMCWFLLLEAHYYCLYQHQIEKELRLLLQSHLQEMLYHLL
jgi:hypothetical protein